VNAIRTLIVDDMRPARAKLRRYLAEEPRVTLVGEASCQRQAVELIAARRPQIAFLDIHLPDGSGLELIESLAHNMRPVVIFVTAFDQHALRAFDVDARDYLLKPFYRERFRLALNRAVERIVDADTVMSGASQRYLSRLTVKDRTGRHFVELSAIDRFDADDHYLKFKSGGRPYLLRGSLEALEPRLDPQQFVRIHRSCLVRMASVKAVRARGNGDYMFVLRDGSTAPIGRSYHGELRARLGLTSF
jgi:two-component system, LytTR family, response regulator